MSDYSIAGRRVLIVGGTSGIGLQIARDVVGGGGTVVLAGRSLDRVDTAAIQFADKAESIAIDLTDESTIERAAASLGTIDHVVSLAADHANGPVADLDAAGVRNAFDAKVVGPILLAKHLAPIVSGGGSFVFFSGVAAWKPAPGLSVMATTNGAVAFLAEALAVELAPVRVNAVSPGIIDSGAWDGMGDKNPRCSPTPRRRTRSVGWVLPLTCRPR